MTTRPPTDSGGQGHKPPESQGGARRSSADARTTSASRSATPSILESTLSGPHHPIDTSSGPSRLSPSAIVTTPSDAQGGGGRANPEAYAGEQPAPLTRAEDAAAQDVRSPTNYAAAVNRGRQASQCAESTPPTHVAGSWKPREQHNLLATLAKNWHSTSEPVDTPEQAALRKVAVAPSEVHADTALRQKTATELEVLLHYLSGSLELPHPPNFAKAVLPLLQRAMLEQYHETHHEAMLTADVTPRAQLRKSMTHNTLIGLLFKANTDTDCGRRMLGRLMDDVKRLHFDGIHTLHFVFNSQRIAQIYAGTAFRLNGTCIVLEDSTSEAEEGVYKGATLRRKYAVRIYGADTIGLVVLLATLGQLPGVKVVDAERPRVDSTDIVDNRYFLLRFDTASCPDMLRGITKLSINGQMITLHHHVVFQRVPCARCYAPYHTVGFCKIKPVMLTKTQAKFRRTYKGPVPSYAVGTATQYRHTDSDSLTNFLATLHRELDQSVAPSSTASSTPEPAELIDERVRPPTVEVAGAQDVMAEEQAPGPQPTDDAETTPPSDGFTVVTRRAGRGQSRAPATTPLPQEGGRPIAAGDTPLEDQREGQSAVTSQSAARSTKPHRQGAHQPLSTPRKSKGKSKKARKHVSVLAAGFDKFKRDRAMGRFTALEDSDDDPELEGSDHDDEEAPYAYAARLSAPVNVSGMDVKDCDPAGGLDSRQGGAALDVLPRELTTDSQGYLPNGQSQQGLSQVRGEEVSSSASDTNMLSVEDTDLSSYVGSSQPSCTQSPVSIPGSEFSFSLDSELNQASTPVAVEEPEGSTRTEGDNSTETGVLLNSGPAHAQTPSLSQDGFSIEGTKPAPGMPQQLPTFLIPFSGSLIKVPGNGQCAYAALYASTTASAEPRLQFTSEVVKDANIIKRSIYTLMMINLANDVECKVVDPCRELKRLYPSQPAPMDVAVATAALYTHYEQERNRSVNAHIPSEFWAGPEVLRAMAQYLREPLFVLDVDRNNDSHVQRYFYQDYTLRNGDTHETGCGGALSDADAKLMLGHYARLHVLPVILVLKRHEGHFYGVNAGDVATKWQAEGDREFATQHCASHRWFSEVMAHMDYCQGLLAQVDVTQDDDATNEILIGAMERRDRLDVIHERLGLARLESDHYDIAILESGLRAEGERLHRVAGPAGSAYRLEPKTQAGGADALVVQRAHITPQGRVALSTMQRILDSINGDPEIIADRSKLRQLQAANAAAIDTWRRKVSQGLRPPTLLGGAGNLPALMNWLVEHREALRSCFACVPYPELAAKCLPMELLVQWGELEVYDLQVATLREVINAEAPSKPTKEYCRTWLAACTVDGGSPRDRLLARDEGRWDRLVGLYANAPSCAKPRDVSEACWHVLHTLPHAVWTWETTPWGTTHRRHLGTIYQAHPAVRQLCEQIAARANWGGAVRLPSGITWDDRQASMGAGPAAPFRG